MPAAMFSRFWREPWAAVLEGSTLDYLVRLELMGELLKSDRLRNYTERVAAGGLTMTPEQRQEWLDGCKARRTAEFAKWEAQVQQLNDWMMGKSAKQ